MSSKFRTYGKRDSRRGVVHDYPHQNSTWPNSREVIDRDMGHLPAADREKLLNTNVRKLYSLKASASLPKAA